MRTTIFTAAMAAGTMVLLAACVSDGTIEGHKIRAAGQTTVVKTEVVQPDIHDRAPQWFKDYWAAYIDHQRHGYAVMAVDRRLRGVFYTYCRDAGCLQLRAAGQHRGWKDVQYKRGSLEGCRENVRDAYPAARPQCAVYAINDKIVWKGRLPWERGAQ